MGDCMPIYVFFGVIKVCEKKTMTTNSESVIKNVWKSFTRPGESKKTSVLSLCEFFVIGITTLSQNNLYTFRL